ncbi:hypothetical protein [Nannocystis punicea]|uniref:Outer membrane lipoprotein-sorting protein n=1 Tax=Nannocystis punicea TaxID=2995304 RepID=A0ABY7HCV8_9BACT|nr:hypothetical protein [Nannocystis poenicansa]WAS97125.1 hypothetical protein O0S08_13335 [Nannocystis poenicansa]
MQRWILAMAMALGGASACDDNGSGEGGKPGAAPQTELTAEQVVAGHLAALGGLDRLKATKNLVIRGEYREGGSVDAFVAYRARPNKFRKEGTHEGKAFVKVFDGDKGWLAEGDAPMGPMPAEHAAKLKQYAEFDDALVDAAARGHRVELVGAAEVKGSKAYQLQVTLANGDVEQRWLDATTFLDVKRTVTFKDKAGAQKTKNVTFSDWREVGGLKFNFASEGEVDGKVSTVKIQSIEVDGSIDPSKFTAQLANTVAMAR